jgi:hypothetical protein
MRRLDRVTGLINPILVVVVMMLVVLDLTCLAALAIANSSISRADPACAPAPSTKTQSDIGGPRPAGPNRSAASGGVK